MNRLYGWAILLAGLLLAQAAWGQATSFDVTTSGFTSFEFDPGGSNPALTLQRGRTYSFNLNTSGHPFWIKTTQVTGIGSAYSSGIGGVGNGAQSGTLTFAVPLAAPDTLYYICEIHAPMTGILNIVDAPRAADFDGDGRSDIFWRNSTTGENYVYPMDGTAILSTEGYARTVSDRNWRIVGIGDFNGDGRADLLWRNSSNGENYIYLMNGKDISGEGYLRTVADQNWKVAGVCDLDGDGKADIVWRNSVTGENYLYPMDVLSIKVGEGYLRTVADQNWWVAGVGDFDNDGKCDILWRNAATGENYLYPMNGTAILGNEGYLRTVADLNWKIVGTGDFNGDGTSDILWRNSATGENYVYPMNGTAILGTEGYLRTVSDLDWKVVGTGDYDGDGKADVLWRHSASGENYLYFMDGTAIKPTEGYLRTVADQSWRVAIDKPIFPLEVKPGKRYLVDATGNSFLMLGESPQAMIGALSEADAEVFFVNRKSHRFNTVWMNLLCAWGPTWGCNSDGTTFDGIAPFTVANDLSTPNEAYFTRVDHILQLAASHGFLVILDPAETISQLGVLQINGLAKARAYGQYLGTRYRNFPNIVWMNGNDFQSWRTNSSDVALVQAVALGIRDNDPNHIHTVLLDYYVSSSLDDSSWGPIISLNAAYTYFPTYAKVLDAYNQSTSVPVFLAEANYEFENNTGMDPSTPAILRRQEYWTALSGATGQLYGNAYTWKFSSGWKNQLDTPGVVQIAHMKALFEPRAWYELVPDQAHTVVTAGYGTFSSTGPIGANDYVTAARTPSGKLVMAYVPTARFITVDMSQLSGPVTARWYDPVVGTFTDIAGSPFANTGSRNFTTPPGTHADGAADWVLVLEVN